MRIMIFFVQQRRICGDAQIRHFLFRDVNLPKKVRVHQRFAEPLEPNRLREIFGLVDNAL